MLPIVSSWITPAIGSVEPKYFSPRWFIFFNQMTHLLQTDDSLSSNRWFRFLKSQENIGLSSDNLGPCLWKMCLNNKLRAPGNYSASIWCNKISICLLTETLHFYDFEIFEPVTKPQNQLFAFFRDTRTPTTNQEKSKRTFGKIWFL